MSEADVKKYHISSNEREAWSNHIGSTGETAHPVGDGVNPGFSTNDFTNDQKTVLSTLANNIGGVRIWINASPPPNPVVDKELWVNPTNNLTQIYKSTGWDALGAVFQ